jgi:hypothetical protein
MLTLAPNSSGQCIDRLRVAHAHLGAAIAHLNNEAQALSVPAEAAERILLRLISSGIVRELFGFIGSVWIYRIQESVR